VKINVWEAGRDTREKLLNVKHLAVSEGDCNVSSPGIQVGTWYEGNDKR